MEDSGSVNHHSKSVDNASTSFNNSLKTVAIVAAGTVTLTYLASKYEDKAKSFFSWLTGSEKDKRRNRKGHKSRKQRGKTHRGRREYYTDASQTSEGSQQSSIDDDRNYRFKTKGGLKYIPEESTVYEESVTHEDVLEPHERSETTSLDFDLNRRGNIFVNSNDEVVRVKESDKAYEQHKDSYPAGGRGNLVNKLYKQREIEASKFVHAIDSAVYDFKLQKVKNYKKMHGLKHVEKEDIFEEDSNLEASQEPASLRDKYHAEMKQINRKGKKALIDEKSVRLNELNMGKDTLKRNESMKSSTLASDDYLSLSKKSNKVITPSLKDLTNKNDYIFFELLSVYADNYLHSNE